MKKDKQFLELLRLNGNLVRLGSDLVASINQYGIYSRYGKSPHMKLAVENWNTFIDENLTRISEKP